MYFQYSITVPNLIENSQALKLFSCCGRSLSQLSKFISIHNIYRFQKAVFSMKELLQIRLKGGKGEP